MKKIEQEFIKASIQNVESKHSFNDIKDSVDFSKIGKVKKAKQFPLWAKIAIPSGTALIAGLVVLFVVLNNAGFFVHYPKLNLSQYKADLSDAESIGIMPLKENDNEETFVKKVTGTGEIKAVNFLSKKDTKNAKIDKNNQVLARIMSNSAYDSFAKEQDKLGWVITSYMVYRDDYTLVRFVPKKQYFEHVFVAGESIDGEFEIVYGENRNTDDGLVCYRIDDRNINHRISGQNLPNDLNYSVSRISKSYVIHNPTGLIYELNNHVAFNHVTNCLYYFDRIANKNGFVEDKCIPIELSIDDNNLLIKQMFVPLNMEPLFVFGNYFVDDVFVDRYGQMFGKCVTTPMMDSDKKVNLLDKDVWSKRIITADNRFLFIQDGTLYEYKDNFSIEAVPDGVTYKCRGYYSDYSFINKDFVFNVSENLIVDIKNEHRVCINAIAIMGDYFIYSSNNELRYVKDPFELYKDFNSTHPSCTSTLLPGGEMDGYYLQNSPYHSNLESLNWWVVNEEYETAYFNLIDSHSSVLSDGIISYENRPADIYTASCQNPTPANCWAGVFETTQIPIDSIITVKKMASIDQTIEYALTIEEDGQISLIEKDKYVPEEREYTLTPINI